MKRIKRYIGIFAAVLLLLPLGLRAQTVRQLAGGAIDVEHLSVQRLGTDRMEVCLTLSLRRLDLASNRFMKFTPLLVAGDSVATLQPLVVAGRRQYIMYRRVRMDEARRSGQAPQLIRRSGREQQADYRAVLPYAPWMEHATLEVAEDLCGCGGSALAQQRVSLTQPAPYVVQPHFAYVTPAVEAVKHRAQEVSAYVDFPVNRTVIRPDYHSNADELAKIHQAIDRVRLDANTRITAIGIHGYASPEGSWSHNTRLAEGRAQALKAYVCEQYPLSDVSFTVQSTPEDWEGLRRYVQDSDLAQREALLRVIDSPLEPDAKHRRLQTVDGGKPYRRLLTEVYPYLRHSDCTVAYTVRPFSVDEGKLLLRTQPELLSLRELFEIAQSYPADSAERAEVLSLAVRLYPHDATAQLNAALAALARADLAAAETLLTHAGDSAEAVHARGLLLLLQDRCDEAEVLLREAARRGVTEAEVNLRQLQQRRASVGSLPPSRD